MQGLFAIGLSFLKDGLDLCKVFCRAALQFRRAAQICVRFLRQALHPSKDDPDLWKVFFRETLHFGRADQICVNSVREALHFCRMARICARSFSERRCSLQGWPEFA